MGKIQGTLCRSATALYDPPALRTPLFSRVHSPSVDVDSETVGYHQRTPHELHVGDPLTINAGDRCLHVTTDHRRPERRPLRRADDVYALVLRQSLATRFLHRQVRPAGVNSRVLTYLSHHRHSLQFPPLALVVRVDAGSTRELVNRERRGRDVLDRSPDFLKVKVGVRARGRGLDNTGPPHLRVHRLRERVLRSVRALQPRPQCTRIHRRDWYRNLPRGRRRSRSRSRRSRCGSPATVSATRLAHFLAQNFQSARSTLLA
eukprot:SAG11_NODE_1550_length_4699_cov_6.841522_2_plen_261_part_00